MVELHLNKNLIKLSSILFYLFFSFKGISQGINFTLCAYNPCTKEIKRIDFFGLEKDGKTYSINDTTKVLQLKDTGIYALSYVIDQIDISLLGRVYHIKTIGDYGDTLRLISIDHCLEPTSHPRFIGYCCCDKECEGAQIDYYENGNKRVEGFFKEGLPIGEVKFYYPTGQLMLLEKYNKRGILLKKMKYDTKGNLIKQNN